MALICSSFNDSEPVYNFTQLDQLINKLWSNGLKPGFEIMGNPSNYFTDMDNKTQVYQWRDLVHQVASRYIGYFPHTLIITATACSPGLGQNYETDYHFYYNPVHLSDPSSNNSNLPILVCFWTLSKEFSDCDWLNDRTIFTWHSL